MESILNKDIRFLKGVGEKRRVLFEKLGVFSIKDLLYYFPRSYNDITNIFNINEAPLLLNCCIKAFSSSPIIEHRINPRITVYKTTISDPSGSLTVTFFNNKFALKKLERNKEFYFFGKIKINSINKKEMVSPIILSKEEIYGLMPIYKATEGLTSKQIETTVKQALLAVKDQLKDNLPEYIKDKYSLCDLIFALKNIHFPKNSIDLEKAKKRLIFEEILTLQLALTVLKGKNKSLSSFKLKKDYSSDFYKMLPFAPTNAQIKTINACMSDMLSGKSMRRLIQGDVGSGKTLVAAALAFNAFKENLQVAFMAPTEILAEQHYNYLKTLFKDTNIKIEMISGSTKKKIKQRIKDNLMLNNIDIIVGTHALLTDDVVFSNLGLIITDEQHRFGVNQREKLFKKGQNPHTIIMSATPIPRSLAMVIYGDLDVSIIDEMPKGRQKIDTYLIDDSKKERAINFVTKFVDEGRQAYIVCPLIEEDDSAELASARRIFKDLREKLPEKYKVGLLHGKMNSFEKNLIMESFLKNEINILVSTTVIEVGIDNPNAVIMMIENAEKLGLSQLHQLRGRVGRGDYKSYCILISNSKNSDSLKRLNILKNSSDGFFIANEDLKTRGPGDFFGVKQHGLPKLKSYKFLKDINILEQTKEACELILKSDPFLKNKENENLLYKIENIGDIIC